MRPDTKLKLARRKHTLELLKWIYARREPQLDGTKISLEHRRSLKEQSRSLTYGEVDVPDFLSILELVKPVQGETFVDLGSGTGKAVLAASCGFPEFSKCRGIELVQGLADAAAENLQTAKTFLATRRASSDNTFCTKATGGALPGKGSTAVVAGASPSTENLGRSGGGARRERGQAPCKAANRGISAVDLEALIADLLSRQSPLPQAKGAGRASGDGIAAGVVLEATAEEVASWLVRELGHRRYKNSLRGYGGLQKFLVSRRGASDTSNGLEIAEDGATVTVAPTETAPFPMGGSSSSRGGGAADDRGEAETTPGYVSVEQGRPSGRRGTAAGVFTDASAPARYSEGCPSEVDDWGSSAEGIVPAPSACLPASTAALSLTSSLPDLSCEEPTVTDDNHPTVTGDRNRNSKEGGDRKSKDGSDSKVFADRRRLPGQGPLAVESLSGVELVCGDIFQEEWNDAGVVYVASLLFNDSMMVLLAKRIQKLREGARVISLKPIPILEMSGEIPGQSSTKEDESDGEGGATKRHRGLQLLYADVFRMSWQMARVYIYLRL